MKVFRYIFSLAFLLIALSTQAQDYELELQGRWDYSNIKVRYDMRYNDIWGYAAPNGREYAIIGSLDSTYFIDVTDPENPVLCDIEAGKQEGCIHRDYKTYGKYCYAVADEGKSSLQIFDLSYLPDSVHKVYDSDSLSQRAHNIFISDDKLFFASNTHNKWGLIPMSIAKLDNPVAPEFIAHLQPLTIENELYFNDVHDVFVRDDIAYCSNGNGGLYIYDFKNPFDKELVSYIRSYPDKGYNHSSWISDDNKYMVFADETHGMRLKCYDISNINKPEYLSMFDVNADKGSIPHNPFIIGDLIFVSYYHEGLVIFSLKDPQNITKVAQYNTSTLGDPATIHDGFDGCWGVYPFLPSGTILASDMMNGLFTFKLKNWETPYKLIGYSDARIIQLKSNWLIDEAIIEFDKIYDGNLSFQVYDLSGRLIQEGSKNVLSRIVDIPLNQQINGMYLLRIITDKQERTFRIYFNND